MKEIFDWLAGIEASASRIYDSAALHFHKNVEVAEFCKRLSKDEKEHYDLSMKVGELVLFPEVRKASTETMISAPGTSCRQQIKDGTGRNAFHPVEILHDSLKD